MTSHNLVEEVMTAEFFKLEDFYGLYKIQEKQNLLHDCFFLDLGLGCQCQGLWILIHFLRIQIQLLSQCGSGSTKTAVSFLKLAAVDSQQFQKTQKIAQK